MSLPRTRYSGVIVPVSGELVVIKGRPGCLRPLQDRTNYRCTGPDGKEYQNLNKAELRALLKRRYPGCLPTFVRAMV